MYSKYWACTSNNVILYMNCRTTCKQASRLTYVPLFAGRKSRKATTKSSLTYIKHGMQSLGKVSIKCLISNNYIITVVCSYSAIPCIGHCISDTPKTVWSLLFTSLLFYLLLVFHWAYICSSYPSFEVYCWT